MDTNKNAFYQLITINKFILKARELDGMEQIVYIHLKQYADINFECFPANITLCKDLNWSPNTVRRILKSLETKGYIKIYQRFNRSNRYVLLPIEEMQGKEYLQNALLEFYINNINEYPRELEKQRILSWQENFIGNSELIFKAMSIAVTENIKKLSYIEAILKDWDKNKIETLEQAENYIKSRNQKWNFTKCKKEDAFNAYEQRSYDFEALEKKLLGYDSELG